MVGTRPCEMTGYLNRIGAMKTQKSPFWLDYSAATKAMCSCLSCPNDNPSKGRMKSNDGKLPRVSSIGRSP
jgi:hypothetical protein